MWPRATAMRVAEETKDMSARVIMSNLVSQDSYSICILELTGYWQQFKGVVGNYIRSTPNCRKLSKIRIFY
jgi:hypothetical protein